MKKTNKLLAFLRENLLFLIIGVALILMATVIAVTVALNNKAVPTVKTPEDSSGGSVIENPISGDDKKDGEDDNKDDEKPVSTVVVFAMPLNQSTIIKDYTVSTVAYNKTLGIYTGHTGIDFGGEENAKVLAVYDGVIESIDTDNILSGVTVVIKHKNNISTYYNSIEVKEGLKVGQTIKQGEEIGTISDNNKQEYKDGQHLHFEVFENDKRINPYKYLTIEQK